MKKNSEKWLPVVIILSLLVVLLLPAAKPTAARSVIGIDRIRALPDDFIGIAATMTIREDSDFLSDFRGGDTFRLILKPGVKWLHNDSEYIDQHGSPVRPTITNTSGSEDLIIRVMSDISMEVTLPNTINEDSITDNELRDSLQIPLAVEINGVTGDIYVNIDPRDSAVISDSNTFTTVWDGGKTTVVSNNDQPQIAGSKTTGWNNIAEALKRLATGKSLTVNLNGNNSIPADVFNVLAGKDATLGLVVDDQITLDLNGKNVNKGLSGTAEINIELDTASISQDMLSNGFAGVTGSRQFTVKHSESYNFNYNLHVYVDRKLAGQYATLFRKTDNYLEKVSASPVDAKGWTTLEDIRSADYIILCAAREFEQSDIPSAPNEFNQPGTASAWLNPFMDVAADDWYYDAARFAHEHGLFTDIDGDFFWPDLTMTRAMMVTALWNFAGKPADSGADFFEDVREGAWYAEAVRWAASKDIVAGNTSTMFAPDDPITREQMAAMLYRYLLDRGATVNGTYEAEITSEFQDWQSVSGWAETPLHWCCTNKLLKGKPSGTAAIIDPQGRATRAETAAILMRLS